MKSKTFEGAIDNVELGNLTGLLAKIKPAMKATSFKGERASKNAAFVDATSWRNQAMYSSATPPF